MNWLRVSSTGGGGGGGGVRTRHWEGGSTSCGGSVAFFAVERDELEGRHREVSDSECASGVDIQAVAVAIAQDRTSDCRVCYTRSARTDSNVAANIWQGRGRRRREEVGKRSANAPEQCPSAFAWALLFIRPFRCYRHFVLRPLISSLHVRRSPAISRAASGI